MPTEIPSQDDPVTPAPAAVTRRQDEPVRWWLVWFLLAFHLAVGAVSFAAVTWLFPSSPGFAWDHDLAIWGFVLDSSLRLFWIVAFLGATGASLHAIGSITYYAQNKPRTFVKTAGTQGDKKKKKKPDKEPFHARWTPWYFMKPFQGAGLAVCLYLVFRAGILGDSAGMEKFNIYGICSVGMLSGLFSDMALKKLKDAFETLVGYPNPNKSQPDPEGKQ